MLSRLILYSVKACSRGAVGSTSGGGPTWLARALGGRRGVGWWAGGVGSRPARARAMPKWRRRAQGRAQVPIRLPPSPYEGRSRAGASASAAGTGESSSASYAPIRVAGAGVELTTAGPTRWGGERPQMGAAASPPRQGGGRQRELPGRAGLQQPRPYSRGSLQQALDIAACPYKASAAKEALQQDAYAETSRSSRRSRKQTWETLARAAGFQDPWVLSPDLIDTVVGALREAGYRTPAAYLTVAKQTYVENGGILTDLLKLHLERVGRACKRGRGPDKHSQHLPLMRLRELPAGEAPWATGGPLAPRRALVIGSWWLLREVELAGARIGHVSYPAHNLVTLLLPISKADQGALGAERTHMCVCDTHLGPALCPACALRSQAAYAMQVGRSAQGGEARGDADWRSWPLFPCAGGGIASKRGVVLTIRQAAQGLQLPLQYHNGAEAFTGQALRATGAVFLAELNVSLWRIQLLGRWGSSAILRYTRTAPLAALANVAGEAAAGTAIAQMAELMARLREQARAARATGLLVAEAPASSGGASGGASVSTGTTLPVPTTAATPQILAPLTVSDVLDLGSGHVSKRKARTPLDGEDFVVNLYRGKNTLHLVENGSEQSPPDKWRAVCGWRFGVECAQMLRTKSVEGRDICTACFLAPAKTGESAASSSKKLAAEASDSSNASTSSDSSDSSI